MIEPDDKNWTWVLERSCPDCGFDASSPARRSLPSLIRSNAGDWRALTDRGAVGPGRPDESTWSSLEYACHVRDVYVRYLGRLELMLRDDDPLFPNWDQDASAVDDAYEDQDPGEVATELDAAADAIAAKVDALNEADWSRPGRRSDGASFTVESILRYMVHDPIHHIWDVTRTP